MFQATTADDAANRPCSPGRMAGLRPMNLLYVSFTEEAARPYLDASTRYRCFHPVEAARAAGHRAFVATQAALGTADPALFDLVVIHRPSATPELLRFVRAAQAAGTRLMADYDDLIFDPAYAEASAMAASSWDLAAVFAAFKRNRDALPLFQEFTVPTAPLRDRIMAMHPGADVQVLPNAVSPSLWSMVASRGYHHQSDRRYIGYFPSAAAPEADLGVAAAGLAELCRQRRIPLRLAGPAPTPAAFRGIEVVGVGVQSLNTVFEELSRCRVAVAPLSPSPLNNVKPHNKVLKALLACTACVATPVPDTAQHCGGPVPMPVSLANDAGDWAAALEERWDGFDLAAAALARDAVVRRFNAASVYAPLFGAPLFGTA